MISPRYSRLRLLRRENRFRPSYQPILERRGKGCHVSDEHAGPNVIPTRTIPATIVDRDSTGPPRGRTPRDRAYLRRRSSRRSRARPTGLSRLRRFPRRSSREPAVPRGRSRSRNRTARGRRTPRGRTPTRPRRRLPRERGDFRPRSHAVDQSIGDLGLDLAGDPAVRDRVDVGRAVGQLAQSGLEPPAFGDADLERVGGEGRDVDRVRLVTVHFVFQAGAGTAGTDPRARVVLRSRGRRPITGDVRAVFVDGAGTVALSEMSTRVPRRPRAVGGRPPQRRRSPAATSRSRSSGSRPVARVRVGTGRK